MNTLIKKIGLLIALGFSFFALAACSDNDAEDAVEDLEDAAENVADGVEDAAEDAADSIEDATN